MQLPAMFRLSAAVHWRAQPGQAVCACAAGSPLRSFSVKNTPKIKNPLFGGLPSATSLAPLSFQLVGKSVLRCVALGGRWGRWGRVAVERRPTG